MIDEPLAEHGEIGKHRANLRADVVRSEITQHGNSQSYLLRRLARDGAEDASKAELFKQVTKGTISAHKAALEAGYRTKKTPLETVKTIIARLETEDVKAIEVIDEPLAQHGGERKGDEQVDAVNLNQGGNSQSYLLRRLARDGAEDAVEIEPMFAAEAKVRQAETLKKGDIPVPVNLPERKNKGDARDQAASVVGVSGKMVSREIHFLHNNSNAIQCDCLKLSEHKRK